MRAKDAKGWNENDRLVDFAVPLELLALALRELHYKKLGLSRIPRPASTESPTPTLPTPFSPEGLGSLVLRESGAARVVVVAVASG